MAEGTVESYGVDDGIGTLRSAATVGGCWVHFSVLRDSFSLEPGQHVWFEFEQVEQDGYAFRATAVWSHDPQRDG